MQFRKETIVNQQYKTIFLGIKDLSVPTRKAIQSNIDRIVLTNDLRKGTLPVESGKFFTDILILEYFLKEKNISEKILTEIEEIIPKYIVHVLRYKEEACLFIAYKELTPTKKINVIKFYSTEWTNYDDINLVMNGNNLDTIFNGFIEQITGGKVEVTEETSIKEAVEKSVDQDKLKKKIEQLEKKMNNTKQFNKKRELKVELKVLIAQLEDNNG